MEEENEIKNDNEETEEDNKEDEDDMDLPTNGISFNKSFNNKPSAARDRNDKHEDDPFKVKSSWIPDLRTEKEWNNFFYSGTKVFSV